jgi:hypothetical protein
MERSTARVFALGQRIDLRAVSGRGIKVEAGLVLIPGYRYLVMSTGEVFAVKDKNRAGYYHRLLMFAMSTGGNPGVITR